MWKKEDGPSTQSSADTRPSTAQSSAKSTGGGGRATIGPSISIKGDVTGSEDLLIQGQIDGSVNLEKHAVGVGSEGRVKANIVGRFITIEGKVEGDLTAEEQIILRGSAQVHGDIKAPRVVLEDGATFRGLVDMGSTSARSGSASESRSSSAKTGSGKDTASSASGASSSSDTSSSATSSSGKGKDASSEASRASA